MYTLTMRIGCTGHDSEKLLDYVKQYENDWKVTYSVSIYYLQKLITLTYSPIDHTTTAKNNIDCGIFVVWTAYQLTLGNDEYVVEDVTSLRKYIFGVFCWYMDFGVYQPRKSKDRTFSQEEWSSLKEKDAAMHRFYGIRFSSLAPAFFHAQQLFNKTSGAPFFGHDYISDPKENDWAFTSNLTFTKSDSDGSK
jgi:hypothetical protein